jgi:hypothetical protein
MTKTIDEQIDEEYQQYKKLLKMKEKYIKRLSNLQYNLYMLYEDIDDVQIGLSIQLRTLNDLYKEKVNKL